MCTHTAKAKATIVWLLEGGHDTFGLTTRISWTDELLAERTPMMTQLPVLGSKLTDWLRPTKPNSCVGGAVAC